MLQRLAALAFRRPQNPLPRTQAEMHLGELSWEVLEKP